MLPDRQANSWGRLPADYISAQTPACGPHMGPENRNVVTERGEHGKLTEQMKHGTCRHDIYPAARNNTIRKAHSENRRECTQLERGDCPSPAGVTTSQAYSV